MRVAGVLTATANVLHQDVALERIPQANIGAAPSLFTAARALY
jgi:hypothetical protein